MIDLRFLATGVLTLSLTFSAYCSDKGKEEADDFLAQNRHGMEEVVQLDDEILIDLGEPEGAQFNLSYRINAAKSGPLSKAATGPLFGLTLEGIKVGGVLWFEHEENQFTNHEQSLQVIHKPTHIGQATFNLRLSPQPLNPVMEPIYDPKKDGSLEEFVKKLMDLKDRFFQQEFETDDFTVPGLGEVTLVFERSRQIQYSKPNETESWLLVHNDKYLNSIIRVPFGFQDEEPASNHDIFVMRHAELNKVHHPDIWYLSENLELQDVTIIEYRTVSDDLIQWAADNNITVREYSQRVSNQRHQVISPPFKCELNLFPKGDALNKYYRFLRECPKSDLDRKFLYADDHKALFEAMLVTWICTSVNHLQDGIKHVFEKKPDTGHKLINLLKRLNPITFPQLKKPGQFILSQRFTTGWYYLAKNFIYANKDGKSKRVVQDWVSEPGQEERVSMTISGLHKADGTWAPLTNLPDLRPVEQEEDNKIVLDLSNHLQGMDETQIEELKNYLQTIFWIKRNEPVIKFIKAEHMSAEASKTIAEKFSNLINLTNCIQLDLAAGFFLAQNELGGWALKMLADFAKRSRTDNSTWLLALNSQELSDLITHNNLKMLDIREGSVLGDPTILACLAESTQIEKIGIKEFNSRQLKTLGLTDNQIIKLATKAWGLEKLELINLPKLTEDSKFSYGLRGSVDTLKHLDVSGTKGLGEQHDHFIAAVRLMQCLEYLNVMKADFSNSQTVAIIQALENNPSLKDVKLTMPYARSSGLLMAKGIVTSMAEKFTQTTLLGKFTGIASSPILIPCAIWAVFVSGTVCTLSDVLTGAHLVKDDPTILACMALAKIPNLASIEIMLCGFRDHRAVIGEMIKYGREVLFKNTNPIEIKFSK